MARILLVHGAFSGAWGWEPLLPALREAGHTVDAIDLPGAGEDTTPLAEVSLAAYGTRICSALADGPPAVLVGHSMGGVAVTQAAASCPQHVRALVYACAFAPVAGQSLGTLLSWPEAADDQVQAHLVVDGDPPVGTLPPEAAEHVIFNACPPDAARAAAARLGPQPIAPFGHPVELDAGARDAFARIPRAYVLCNQDRAIPPAMQRRMLSEAGCDPVIELEADHWPWVSAPDGFLAALDRIASAYE